MPRFDRRTKRRAGRVRISVIHRGPGVSGFRVSIERLPSQREFEADRQLAALRRRQCHQEFNSVAGLSMQSQAAGQQRAKAEIARSLAAGDRGIGDGIGGAALGQSHFSAECEGPRIFCSDCEQRVGVAGSASEIVAAQPGIAAVQKMHRVGWCEKNGTVVETQCVVRSASAIKDHRRGVLKPGVRLVVRCGLAIRLGCSSACFRCCCGLASAIEHRRLGHQRAAEQLLTRRVVASIARETCQPHGIVEAAIVECLLSGRHCVDPLAFRDRLHCGRWRRGPTNVASDDAKDVHAADDACSNSYDESLMSHGSITDNAPTAPHAPAPLAGEELPKSYSPKAAEPFADSVWKRSGAFRAVAAAAAPPASEPYAIFIPPPNVTAALHLGHALNNTLQDVLIRAHRMMGCNTLWMPGTDHAGIATQTVVEKRLLLQGKKRTDFTREAFIAKVQEWKDEYEATIVGQLESMGCSCDFSRTRFTMDDVCATAVREAFFRLFKDGLIYRGYRLVNWDPVSRTALADDEVEMEEVQGHMWYLRYPLTDGSGFVTVASTRPETMLGDSAVAMNPKDPRAAQLRGKTITLPIVGRVIPIVEDDYVVLPADLARQVGGNPDDPKAAFATGFLKVTPAHDPNDWEIGQRHGLAAINVLAEDASISDRHGWDDVSTEAKAFVGLSREEARTRIVQWFRDKGLLEKAREYAHSVGHSYRSHVPIEPYLSEQWYVKVTDDRLAGAALRSMVPDQVEGAPKASTKGASRAGDGELRFFPERYAKTFQSWHENIRDWCISRQLWWGHRIPVWIGERSDALPAAMVKDARLTEMTHSGRRYVAVRGLDDREAIAWLESHGFAQDPDVLDTWFSSALWPISTLGWPDPTAVGLEPGLLDTFNPSNVLCTAREIITLWVSRMVMFNRYFLDGRLPFRDVFIHAMIQDGFGQKMSKSLGNGVDPRDIIHSHGADAMRFTLVQMTTNTQDVRMPVDMIDPHSGEIFAPKTITTAAGYVVSDAIQRSPKDPTKTMVSGYGYALGIATPTDAMPLARNTSSKFDFGRNFCNKLFNATRFALGNFAGGTGEPVAVSELSLVDRWIIARLQCTELATRAALDAYRFNEYAEAMYDFVWRDFCDWYLEAIKPTVKSDPRQRRTLRTMLDAALRLLHPVCPFITESLWPHVQASGAAGIPGIEVPPATVLASAAWPRIASAVEDAAACATFERVQSLVSAIRNKRGERQVQPKRRIRLQAPNDLLALVRAAEGVVEQLAGLEGVELTAAVPPLDAVAFAFEGSEVILTGLVDAVDATAERGRLEKEIAGLRAQITGFQSKLGNASYVAKAKPELVEETRSKMAKAEADLAAATRLLESILK